MNSKDLNIGDEILYKHYDSVYSGVISDISPPYVKFTGITEWISDENVIRILRKKSSKFIDESNSGKNIILG